jgi:hypothetical protein
MPPVRSGEGFSEDADLKPVIKFPV